MKKIMDSESGRLLIGLALMFAYVGVIGGIMNLLGLKLMITSGVSALLAVCYTMKAIDSHYKSKEEGISFKTAWNELSNAPDEGF